MKQPLALNGLNRTITTMLGAIVLFIAFAPSLSAQATEPGRVNAERPMLGPWVPPALRNAEPAPPTTGAALQAQIEQKLLAQFSTADKTRSGAITREQAQSAGLGFVVNHFEQIDRRKTGAVRFDEVKHFLRERGAQLN